jgi:Glycosyltransferase family 87
MRAHTFRNGILVCVAVFLVTAFVLSSPKYLRDNLAKRDSIAYWATGKLLLARQNPYSFFNVLTLERSQGYSEAKPLVLRTPPWSLFLVAPLGFANAFLAWVIWVAISLIALVVSVRLSWSMYGGGPRPPTIFPVVAYLFAPVPACLVAGQMGLVLLLGLTVFLWAESRHRFLAGASLILPFAKPHLLSLFWVILLVWIADKRKARIAAGLLSSIVLFTVIALIIDPAVFSQYATMLHEAAVGQEFIPAVSGVIRLIFFRRLFWVQFIPMAVGLMWSVWFYWKKRSNWNWQLYGPALIVVSLLTTPYAWLTDEVLLVPAMLQAVVWVHEKREQLTIKNKLIIGCFAALNLLLLLILKAKVPFSTGIYFWSSLVWFAWYFYTRRFWNGVRQSRQVAGGHL